MTLSYSGGIKGNIRYHSQTNIKVGIDQATVNNYKIPILHRGVLIFNIDYAINNVLATRYTSYNTVDNYTVLSAILSLSSSNGKTAGNIYAFMVPTNTPIDESVSWETPTQNPITQKTTTEYECVECSHSSRKNWSNGGSIEPLAKDIIVKGIWNNQEVMFDLTPFVNIWMSSKKTNFAVIITSDEKNQEIWEFYSQQAETPLLGGSPLTNVTFLGAGDTNTMNTEGIVVKISPQLPHLTIDSSDNSTTGMNRWAAFNASVSIGDTFSMFLPDAGISASVYTLLDKRTTASGDTQFLVSGSVSGFETQKHGTAEFSCNGRVESGSGIVEFTSPNNSLKVDLTTVMPENTIIFDYKPTITPNNAKSFTVDFVLDENLKNNRTRIYVKEETASENRNGLPTTVRKSRVRPRLSLNLLV